MTERARHVALGVVVGAAGLAMITGAAGLGAIYTGAYNVAASEEHGSFTRWALDTTFRKSVERRASDLAAPENLSPERIEAGAGHYKAMCQHCHGGPGIDPAEWSRGMRPQPPHLTEAASHWTMAEVFWLVRHGVRMSGMPGFGATHDDDALWEISALVKELPGMSAEDYQSLAGAPAEAAEGTDGHHH